MEFKLLDQIEALRKEMVNMAEKRRLCDPQIVSVSQRLDFLLNQYQLQFYTQETC